MSGSSRTWKSALLVLAAAGCSEGTTPPVSADAELKVVHASSQVGTVDVSVGGVSAVSGLAAGQSSAIVDVPSGSQVIVVRSNGVQVAQLTAMLGTAHRNALTIADDTVQVTTVTPDTGAVVTSRANVRVINVASASTADPTMLTLLVNFPGVGADSVASMGLDTKVASHGTLMYFDAGHFRVRLVPTAAPATILAQVEFDVAAGQAKAIVIERAGDGSYSMRIVTES